MGKLPARMAARRRQALAILLALVAALALGACGDSHTPLTHEDNTGAGGVNSNYVTLGGVKYQVQVSRQLNPYKESDLAYLAGIPQAARYPQPGYLWFAVFLLALNPSSTPAQSVSSFSLSDTQGNVYYPLTLPGANLYAYHATVLAPGQQIPTVDSPGYYSPTQASLLLFKVPVSVYDNRPLVLTLTDPTDPSQTATVTLDV
jgi:hypothetical protein